MINQFEIQNCGPIKTIKADSLTNINLIIGENSCGKTFLLKMLYSIVRSQEEFGRGNDNRGFNEVLSDKLYWTFQNEKLGDIVRKGKDNKLKVSFSMADKGSLVFEFTPSTTKEVTPAHNNLSAREANSIFLPPKEVLSLHQIILKSALQDKVFGYDATYADLILALQNQTQRGRNYEAFKNSRKSLEEIFSGRIEYDTNTAKWVYKRGNAKFSIHNTAEGIKKIAILDTLLGNRFITPDSIIFIDEPESALHPTAITKLLDIVKVLSEQGIQFFIASHSYYVVKKLELIAHNSSSDVTCFIADKDGDWAMSYLKRDGLPENEIIGESVRLFEQSFNGFK